MTRYSLGNSTAREVPVPFFNTGHRVATGGVEREVEVVAGEVEIEGRELFLIVKELGDRMLFHLGAGSTPASS